MIESFSIKNFLSYKSEQVISFLASNREKDHDELTKGKWFKEYADDTKLLKLMVFVGNNGTGKSNALCALDYLRFLVTNKADDANQTPPYSPFELDETSKEENTVLKLTYYIQEDHYEYEIQISRKRIESEELRLLAGRKTARVFYRYVDSESGNVNVTFGNACDLTKKDQNDLILNMWSNSSLLSIYNTLNIYSEVLSSNYDYFNEHISLVHMSRNTLAERLSIKDEKQDHIMRILMKQLFEDLTINIIDYKVYESDLGFLNDNTIPADMLKMLLQRFPNGKQKILNFVHKTKAGEFEINADAESRGTLNIIKLMVVIYDIIIGEKSSMLDEFGNGIDSKALSLLFKLYLKLAGDNQLIIATQNNVLLDENFLRRDAVRIFDKNEFGESEVGTVDQSNIHRNKSLFNWYWDKTNPELIDRLVDDSVFHTYVELVEEFKKES